MTFYEEDVLAVTEGMKPAVRICCKGPLSPTDNNRTVKFLGPKSKSREGGGQLTPSLD